MEQVIKSRLVKTTSPKRDENYFVNIVRASLLSPCINVTSQQLRTCSHSEHGCIKQHHVGKLSIKTIKIFNGSTRDIQQVLSN